MIPIVYGQSVVITLAYTDHVFDNKLITFQIAPSNLSFSTVN